MTTTDDRVHALLGSVPTQLFVDGAWTDAQDGRTLDVLDPATGRRLTSVADAGSKVTFVAVASWTWISSPMTGSKARPGSVTRSPSCGRARSRRPRRLRAHGPRRAAMTR